MSLNVPDSTDPVAETAIRPGAFSVPLNGQHKVQCVQMYEGSEEKKRKLSGASQVK